MGYTAKAIVFPGNVVRALNHMQNVPKTRFRNFLWNLFEQGPGLVCVKGTGDLELGAGEGRLASAR
jgi:hypothetical protein